MPATIRDRRNTAQKEAVTHALETACGFISAAELHQRLSSEGISVGLATVYRQLNALVETGRADTVPVAGGQLFRACEPGDHHHHLVCENCGTAVEIDPPSEDWILATAARNGFTVTRHILEVFGRCAACPV
ncbi:Fur family transcriptional regulator [Microbacterium marinilacus]|uniref:Transcriptional repressor n=1 Tax=Microbacterium marinilacus TaxID=415209 RepID=A0ABP7BHP7_9MICO|nr:transcriptional repressor [Microbacterium marinilacus]MBY0687597.1 transcriptional repressor [Microbacterium marinilacus]